MDRSSTQGALVETSKAPRRVGAGRRVRGGVWGGYFYLLFDLKMERFGAVFKLDLTEETRMQLQEEEAIASRLLLPHTGYAYAYCVYCFTLMDPYYLSKRVMFLFRYCLHVFLCPSAGLLITTPCLKKLGKIIYLRT